VLLNLGGMANVTYLEPGSPPPAFDVGPANALLDGLARAWLERPFDAQGATARRGRVSAPLLAELLGHPFFARRPPKSTLQRWLPRAAAELVLCGGGVWNRALFEELERRTHLVTLSSAERGVDPDAREAMLFAHLAVRFVLGRPSTQPTVTGARAGGVLGKLSLPPVRAGRFGPRP
jgi:anhydro-N-acetylmuramic acid kinase